MQRAGLLHRRFRPKVAEAVVLLDADRWDTRTSPLAIGVHWMSAVNANMALLMKRS